MKKIGFFGGTFDPPHLGHLFLAKSAIKNLELDKLVFSVANLSPAKEAKPPVAAASKRFKMVQLMIEGQEKMIVSDYEIQTGGLSYTINLVNELRNQYPDDKLFMIVSNDVLNVLDTFRESQKILKECTVAVGSRASYALNATIDHVFFENNFLPISSTELRYALKLDRSSNEFLDAKVFDYIIQNRLYS